MDSCEIVKKAIEFGSPECIPIISLEMDPDNDNCFIDYGTSGAGAKLWEPLRVVKDEWGCVWQRTEQDNMGQVKEHPLKDWKAMKDYKFPDKICFANFVDIQTTLVSGTLDEVRDEAKLLIKKWSTSKGGFIGFDVDYECIGVSKERRDVMIRAFKEFGRLP